MLAKDKHFKHEIRSSLKHSLDTSSHKPRKGKVLNSFDGRQLLQNRSTVLSGFR